jgi:hypothetical protein
MEEGGAYLQQDIPSNIKKYIWIERDHHSGVDILLPPTD